MNKLMSLAILCSIQRPVVNTNYLNCPHDVNYIMNNSMLPLRQYMNQAENKNEITKEKVPAEITLPIEETKKESKKRDRPAEKESYRCSCKDLSNTSIWKINEVASIRLCKKCKKGAFIVNCTAEKFCKSCSIRGVGAKPCEISLKFRRRNFNNFDRIVDQKLFVNVHVFQNVFQRFNAKSPATEALSPSNEAKKRKLSHDEDQTFTQKNNPNKKMRGSLKSLIESNQHILPFTFDELMNMKLQETQEKEKALIITKTI